MSFQALGPAGSIPRNIQVYGDLGNSEQLLIVRHREQRPCLGQQGGLRPHGGRTWHARHIIWISPDELPFIHFHNKNLLWAYYVPGTVLNVEASHEQKLGSYPSSTEILNPGQTAGK